MSSNAAKRYGDGKEDAMMLSEPVIYKRSAPAMDRDHSRSQPMQPARSSRRNEDRSSHKVVGEKTGIVKRWHEAQGYGFVVDADGLDYFIHYSDIRGSGFRNLARGQFVKFTAMEGPSGLYATDVMVMNF